MSTVITIITTTTAEVSSNSNSSCRLLDCLSSLPFQDQRAFRNLFSYKDFVCLSACCRSLKSSIRNDRLLWQALYHRDFLSGPYYVKEMEFVLWCIRTDVNNPCTSDKRADLLENVDWYNTYRRRVSTENNWRYKRCKTTHIDMEQDKDEVRYKRCGKDKRIIIAQQDHPDETSSHSYVLDYLPHPNLKSSNNIVCNSTLSTSLNFLSLGSANEAGYDYVLGDHYIAVSSSTIKSDTHYNVKILTRKHGDVFTTFDVPGQYRVMTIEGKWALLVHGTRKSYKFLSISGIMVFDIDNSVMCQGSIGDTWGTIRSYKTTNDTAILYTARLVKDDDVGRIEWALHQFSSNNPAVQLRSGWFQLPEMMPDMKISAHHSYDSHMILNLRGNPHYNPFVIHNVGSSGQSHTPRNCYTMTARHIPIPLLRAGCKYLTFDYRPRKVLTDLTYHDDQILQIPDVIFGKNIIGNIYVFITGRYNRVYNRLLVDINTKKTTRKLGALSKKWRSSHYAMFGMLSSSTDKHTLVIQEYGEL